MLSCHSARQSHWARGLIVWLGYTVGRHLQPVPGSNANAN